MDVLTGLWESFHNVYIYQIITLKTLNILQFYLSMTSIKLEGGKLKSNSSLDS